MSRKRHEKSLKDGWNSHHILHYRRWWNKGYCKKLRHEFVYSIPVGIHRLLHEKVKPVPALSEDEAKWLWLQFKRVDHKMELFEALGWLQSHATNPAFGEAIANQAEFLSVHLGRS